MMEMKALGRDIAGLESLPLKLMIVGIVATLSIIPAGEALANLKNRDFVRRAELQLEKIATSAEILAIGGPGNVRTFSLDFTGQGSMRFERIVIGDERDGSNISSVVLHLRDGAIMARSANEPATWLMGPDGERLELTSPVFDLRMSCVVKENANCVIVEAV